MKKIIYILLALGLCGGAIGYTMFNKKLPSTENQSTDLKISASALLTAYEEDENKSNEMYLDKVMEVSGTVDKIEKSAGKVSVFLSTDNDLSRM